MADSRRFPGTIRPAQADDAAGISALYSEAYAGSTGGEARNHYPFPQFLDPVWVAGAVEDERLIWIVAEIGADVVGAVGAVCNIGTRLDRIAEFFGLVVDGRWRGVGVGEKLLTALTRTTSAQASFMIGETRTADAGGWHILRRHEWIPLGFEPFAHTTPVGSEPMILLAKMADEIKEQRDLRARTSIAVNVLARETLGTLGVETMPASEVAPYPVVPQPWHELSGQLAATQSSARRSKPNLGSDDDCFRIVEDDVRGIACQRQWRDISPHASGVVELNRLEGEDREGTRFTRKYFVGFAGNEPLACARVVWDHRDRRARILYLQTRVQGLQGLMIAYIVECLERESARVPLSIVIDVRTDFPSLQATLEKLAFFPTVYYPGFIADRSGRVDAVQYTRLFKYDYNASLKWVREVDWPAVSRVVEAVTSLAVAARNGRL